MTQDQLLTQFFEAISNQSDVLVAISGGGFTLALAIIIRSSRTSYRGSVLGSSIFVMSCFAVSIVCGYLIDSKITGYFHQMIHGEVGSGAAAALALFKEYSDVFKVLSLLQIAASLIGLFGMPVLAVQWDKAYRHRTSQGERTDG